MGSQPPRRGRVRVDQRLLELGLESTRARAQARILAGDVRLLDRRVDKPGTLVPADAELTLRERPRFVSRGGEKLAGALEAFDLDPAGLRCADVGASTGGFTDCLLQRGAVSVLALDVGYGQLAHSLRVDPRVTCVERTNIRHYEHAPDAELFDLVTADLSFISAARVLPRIAALARPGGQLLILVKPQFELERGAVGSGGVVRDPELRLEAARRVREAGAKLGLEFIAESESVLHGPKGNRERFVLMRSGP